MLLVFRRHEIASRRGAVEGRIFIAFSLRLEPVHSLVEESGDEVGKR